MFNSHTNNRFGLFYHSLRGKFILASVLVGIVLILSSLATYIYINQSSSGATMALQQRINKLNDTRAVMDNIWDVSLFLEEHSIAPSESNRRLIAANMTAAKNRILHITEFEAGNSAALQTLRSLLSDLDNLAAYIDQLLKIRTDPAQLFPAIQVSRVGMYNNQSLFSDFIALGIDEALVNLNQADPQALIVLMDLRYKWSQMISFYRMYLINRLVLLDKDELDQQISNIDLFLTAINKDFELLTVLDENNKLELQASEALPEMKKASRGWVDSFRKTISETDTPEAWRTDYPIIKSDIAPLIKHIWENVLDYDRNIELDVNKSLNDLSSVATHIGYLLWVLTASGLTLLALLFYFIHRTLLTPIQQISRAMRQEAQDGRYFKPLLIQAHSLETANLIDAFSMMQLQVHSRKHDLEHQALHDNLTGLPNRLLLFDRLQQEISKAERNNSSLSLLMMDLDRFKEINDTLGHHAGDELLKKVGSRLVAGLRHADTVARLGGDEFAILVPDCDAEQSKSVALKIRESMQAAIQVNQQSLYMHGSLGIANYPEHGVDAETLVKNADIAMYVAKRNNSVYEIYDYDQDQHTLDRLELKHRLQKAIQNGELELYYQPQIHCQNMNIVAVEALLRWHSHETGFIPPDIFIPLAEESGLIKNLSEWVIIEAIKQQQLWQQQNLEIHISINLSAWNLLDPGLDVFVLGLFQEYGVKKGGISFEITESVMMTDTDQALKMMRKLNQLGSDLIIDDYGTGFSSLAYLQKFPMKELKIDKSFVIDMIDNENDAVIVKSTIDLAHNLGFRVIAEGVETLEALQALRLLGCDMAQGYYVARPMSADKLQQWYISYRP